MGSCITLFQLHATAKLSDSKENKHLLVVASPRMLTKNVRDIYTIDVVLSTTYLINGMSSKAIDMTIPLDLSVIFLVLVLWL